MKIYIAEGKSVKQVMTEMRGKLTTDYFIGGLDGSVEVIVGDTETYLDNLGMTGEPYVEEEVTE